ncbi:MAG: hypothetical protein KGZ51_00920 [Erysipelothrix sp.]|jgi:hypothetical protein|nr:hypothetical protein [Erysipelothrix sp.]
MFFHEKFSYLYRLFNVNHKLVSKQCGFDVSLLSRWKNGNRVPSYKNGQYRELAKFFLAQIKTQAQREELNMIIAGHRTIATHLTSDLDVFEDWLVVSNSKPQIPLMNYAANSDTLTHVRSIITGSENSIEHPVIQLDLSTRTDVYIYKDNIGKRNAVLYFLKIALELTEVTDIYIFSDEDSGWWIEDDYFPVLWANYLKRITSKGHRLSVIFMNSRPSELYIRALNTWFPLMLNGKVNAFYFPNYAIPSVRSTTFIIKEKLAYVSLSSQLSDYEKIGYLHFDITSIHMQTALFLGRMATCRSLVTTYTTETQLSLLERMVITESAEFNMIIFNNLTSPFFLPLSVFERYALTLPQDAAERYMSIVRRYLLSRSQVIINIDMKEVINLKTMRDLILDPEHTFFESRFFANRVMKLTSQEVRQYCESIKSMVEEYKNYHLIFLRKPSIQRDMNINITVREHIGVVMTPTSPSKLNHIALVTTEGNTVFTLHKYLSQLLSQIPTVYKEKEETLQVLKDLINLIV